MVDVMAASTNNLSQGADDAVYKALQELAKAAKPDGTFYGEIYAAGILKHDKVPSACLPADFLWFKVKGKHSIGKLRKAYHTREGVEVNLKHSMARVSDETQIRQLNYSSDNVVVFTSYQLGMDGQSPLSSFSSQNRTPLGPSNTQFHNSPAVPISSHPVKQTSTYADFWESQHSSTDLQNLHTTDPRPYGLQAKDENERELSHLSPLRARIEERYSDAPTRSELTDFVSFSHTFGASSGSTQTVKTENPLLNGTVKNEPDDEEMPILDEPSEPSSTSPDQENTCLRKLLEKGNPEQLEAEVEKSLEFLEILKAPLAGMVDHHKDAQYFTQQIQLLKSQQVETPTIIGVVGNTGAGKSSVINAMLEEERLVPTNCMRACTAVVTEMSWNSSEDEYARYRADVEFIQPADWEKDLRVSLTELIDGSGNVSRDCTNTDSEAGIAYAKIKAVYPQKTREELANSSVEELMNEPSVKEVLGKTRKVEQARPEPFYRALQHFVDSKEKATTGESKKKEKLEKRQMEFWPLIKVVRIYTKADALSTGAVIVDLPGVHDSNAARAAVAAGYMKQCTGLWIVAPINRAVDDKAAKSLLGESFKRQLKYDGTYSRITFICSKTDDISIMEASDSLDLEEEMAADWEQIDKIERDKRSLKETLKDLKDSRSVYADIINDVEDAIDIWDKLKDDLEDGKTVYAPSDKSKKRKRSAEPKQSRKKSKKSKSKEDDYDDDNFIVNNDDSEAGSGSESSSEMDDPLTLDAIEEKLVELKKDKKKARKARADLDTKAKNTDQELESLVKNQREIEARMSAICIQGRNEYSKRAIQQDFAAGIKELDMENAQEDENFDPEAEDLRDYDEVARSLPVFCVSSRAAQKLAGRLQRDSDVPGFRSEEETGIPQLRQHCKLLTEAGRASNCRLFLTNLSQLLTSLGIWAFNDGTGLNLSDSQMAVETRFLKNRLTALEKSLDNAVHECLKEMNQTLAENIFENYDHVVQLAIDQAGPQVQRWHAPVNRDNRLAGGYYWATYKAIVRREGVYSNAQGPHDFNEKLTEPIIKHLAGHWERVFAQRLPRALINFTRQCKLLLSGFHSEIEARSMKQGAGVAGIAMLGQQLRNYEAIFQTLAIQMGELINNLQREANREFTPVIARNLSSAYDWCAAESGSGCFNRMKHHMSDHVDSHKGEMFRESCDEVRTRLNRMVREVEEAMANKTDEVFICMSRDYTEIISGKKSSGEVMPKAERQMRAEVARRIQEREQANAEVDEAEEKAGTGAVDDPNAPEATAATDEPLDEGESSAAQLKAELVDDDMGNNRAFRSYAGDMDWDFLSELTIP